MSEQPETKQMKPANIVITDWQTEITHHRDRAITHLLGTMLVGGAISILTIYLIAAPRLGSRRALTQLAPLIIPWFFILVWGIWPRMTERHRAIGLIGLSYLVGVILLVQSHQLTGGQIWFLMLTPIAFVLLGERGGIITGVASLLAYGAVALIHRLGWVVPHPSFVTIVINMIHTEGPLFVLAILIMIPMFSSLARSLMKAAQEAKTVSRQLATQLESQAQAYRQLQTQSILSRATNQIIQTIGRVLSFETLPAQVVQQVEHALSDWDVYHVGLFLLNVDGESDHAVLKAATSETGRLAVETGYRIKVDTESPIGQVIIRRQASILSAEERQQTTQLGALVLPHTHSEIVIPLQSGEEIIGVLDIHSGKEDAFDEENLSLFQMMAGQVATAIRNAQLFSRTNALLEEVQDIQRRYLGEAWRELLSRQPARAISSSSLDDLHRDPSIHAMRRQAMTEGEIIVFGNGLGEASEPEGHTGAHPSENGIPGMIVPLKIRGQVIGTITVCDPRSRRRWTETEINMAETIAEQIALTIENLRLLEETQRRAAQERLIGEIAGQVRASLNPDTVLKTTIRELGRALGAEVASIEITPPPQEGPNGSPPTGYGDAGV